MNRLGTFAIYIALVSRLFLNASAVPLGSAFTYQGRLLDARAPANGNYDFQFRLHDSLTGSTETRRPVILSAVPVSNGVFTVELDFGAGAFSTNALWLAIGVRPGNSTNAFEFLPVRQPLTAVPQSQYALLAGDVIDGSITAGKIATAAVTTEKIANGAVTGTKIAPNEVVRSLNGLREQVVLEAGTNVTIVPDGNRLRIAAPAPPLNATNVMDIILNNDGIGSGLSADFIDGIDSANLARKTEVLDRVLRDGDTMTGALTLQPFPGAQALITVGTRRGTWNDSVAYFANRQNATNVSPAVRIENSTGTSPDGAVSISNNGLGYIARFGNSSKYVGSLETDGTLHLNPNAATEALILNAPSSTTPLLRVQRPGGGNLATFGDGTTDRLTIDYAGSLTANGQVQGGSLRVLGNATINGDLSARNLPALTTSQGDHSEAYASLLPDMDHKISEVFVNVPGPGFLFISSHVAFQGIARPPSFGGSLFTTRMRLEQTDALGNATLLGSHQSEQYVNVFSPSSALRLEVTRVLRVDQAGTVRLRTLVRHTSGPSQDGTNISVAQRGLNAIYFGL